MGIGFDKGEILAAVLVWVKPPGGMFSKKSSGIIGEIPAAQR